VSRVTSELGPAVLQAAAEARNRLFQLAAPILGATAEELQSKNGQIYVNRIPGDRSAEDVTERIDPEEPIRGSGARARIQSRRPFSIFGAQAVELEVDVETGEVDILRIAAAHDFGRAINPKLCVSQVQGGIEFGIGFALSEEGLYDPRTGKLLNRNLHQYHMPTSLDMPRIDTFLAESDDSYFAYSAKGAGRTRTLQRRLRSEMRSTTRLVSGSTNCPFTPDKLIMRSGRKRKAGEPLLYELPIFEHADATTIEESGLSSTTYGEKPRIMAEAQTFWR